MSDANYKWFSNVRRYRDPSGRFVSQAAITEHIDRLASSYSARLRERGDALAADFTADEFYNLAAEVRRDLEQMHNAVAVIALGGLASASANAYSDGEVWRQVGEAVGAELRFFDSFMFGVVAGVVSLGNFANRLSMYPLMAYATYENAVRAREANAEGYDEERRDCALDGATCDDCLIEARLGWQPVGTLRRIGNSACRGRCRCRFRFRKRPVEDQ